MQQATVDIQSMTPSVTTAIYLDKRKARKDGTFPIKLRITYLRKQKYYATGISLAEADFEKATAVRPRGAFKEYQLRFAAIEDRAREIIERLDEFSFAEFEKHWKSKRSDRKDVFQAFESYIEALTKEDKIRTAEGYRCSLRSIQGYSNRKRLAFADITLDWLKAYERWMLDQGKSTTTISIYLRNLRTIFNQARQTGDIPQDLYPFGKHQYQVPQSRNIKKALTIADVKKIVRYQPEAGSTEARYRDYWLFSYLCNGVNFKDMALLRYRDLTDTSVIFTRAKTRHSTRTDQKPIVAPLIDPVKAIIERWGNPADSPDSYVFPMLREGLTAKEQAARIHQEIKQTNKYMRRIGQAVGIEKDITTYTARHTFSTVLKRAGTSKEFISESLGHTNLTTTERYLDSFEDEVKRGYAEKLLDFGEE